ncbi:MAG: ABC transporter permease [Bacteroidota bacterium]
MLTRNYVTTALRNFTRHKRYSFINVLGLSIAIAFCLLVYLFINDELSFDRFHANRERIYRINDRLFTKINFEQGDADPYRYQSALSNALGAALRTEAPEVEHVTQIKRGGKQTIKISDEAFGHREHSLANLTST